MIQHVRDYLKKLDIEVAHDENAACFASPETTFCTLPLETLSETMSIGEMVSIAQTLHKTRKFMCTVDGSDEALEEYRNAELDSQGCREDTFLYLRNIKTQQLVSRSGYSPFEFSNNRTHQTTDVRLTNFRKRTEDITLNQLLMAINRAYRDVIWSPNTNNALLSQEQLNVTENGVIPYGEFNGLFADQILGVSEHQEQVDKILKGILWMDTQSFKYPQGQQISWRESLRRIFARLEPVIPAYRVVKKSGKLNISPEGLALVRYN